MSTTYKRLAKDAVAGDRVLVDDGNVGLVVEHIDGDDVVCTVTEGGPVSNNKGMSLPGMNVSAPRLVGQGHRGSRVRAAASASTWSRCRSCARRPTSSWSTR